VGAFPPVSGARPFAHAALWNRGTATDLGLVPTFGNMSAALAINDGGQVVGYATSLIGSGTTTIRPAVWPNGAGSGSELPVTSGDHEGQARAINERGEIAGMTLPFSFSPPPDNPHHAVVWEPSSNSR